MKDEELLEVGVVRKTHGVKGGIFVKMEGEGLFFKKGVKVFIESEEYEIKRAVRFKKGVILNLKGIRSIEDAQQLVGKRVFIRKGDLPKENGEYYWYELVGMEVYTTENKFLGKIDYIIPTGEYDVFVIRADDGSEIMIPYADEFVLEIDSEKRRMVVDTHGMEEI